MLGCIRISYERGIISIPVLVLAIVIAFHLSALAQEEVIRVETQVVKIPVSILDRQGRSLELLTRNDFTIYENGVAQDLLFFESREAPITVMLLVDVSGSMSPYKSQLGASVDAFIARLRPDDTIIVATFCDDRDLDFRVPATLKRLYSGPKATAYQPKFPSQTYTSDAVMQAIRFMEQLRGRRAIVLFGDGDPSHGKASPESNLRQAEETEVSIYTIRYGDFPRNCVIDYVSSGEPRSTAESRDVSEILSKYDLGAPGNPCAVLVKDIPKLIKRVKVHFSGLAEKTGGRAYEIQKITDLNLTFEKIINELSQTYLIGYEPKLSPREGERRRIKVMVDRQDVAVRSRTEVIFKKIKDL